MLRLKYCIIYLEKVEYGEKKHVINSASGFLTRRYEYV